MDNIGSENGLAPYRRQAISWTNADLLLIRSLWTNFLTIKIKILSFYKNALKNLVCHLSTILFRPQYVNSSPPSAAYMHQWTESTWVQVMACRLFSAKPLPEPILPYCQLDPWKQTPVKFESKYKTFHSWKCTWKCHLGNGGHFV